MTDATPEITPLGVNQRQCAASTPGISRNMQLPDVIVARTAPDPFLGGGDQNGTAALILFLQAGTAGDRLANPRKPPNPGNYCGVV